MSFNIPHFPCFPFFFPTFFRSPLLLLSESLLDLSELPELLLSVSAELSSSLLLCRFFRFLSSFLFLRLASPPEESEGERSLSRLRPRVPAPPLFSAAAAATSRSRVMEPSALLAALREGPLPVCLAACLGGLGCSPCSRKLFHY